MTDSHKVTRWGSSLHRGCFPLVATFNPGTHPWKSTVSSDISHFLEGKSVSDWLGQGFSAFPKESRVLRDLMPGSLRSGAVPSPPFLSWAIDYGKAHHSCSQTHTIMPGKELLQATFSHLVGRLLICPDWGNIIYSATLYLCTIVALSRRPAVCLELQQMLPCMILLNPHSTPMGWMGVIHILQSLSETQRG